MLITLKIRRWFKDLAALAGNPGGVFFSKGVFAKTPTPNRESLAKQPGFVAKVVERAKYKEKYCAGDFPLMEDLIRALHVAPRLILRSPVVSKLKFAMFSVAAACKSYFEFPSPQTLLMFTASAGANSSH